MLDVCCDCIDCVEKKIPVGDTRVREVCVKCNKIYYQNPKIIAGILPLFEDKILLCKRSIEPKKDFWTIPGGFMECDETLQEAALREANEEAGINPELGLLHTIYDLPKIGQVYFVFLGHCKDDRFECGEETAAAKWVTYEDIPWQDIAFLPVVFALKQIKSKQLPVFGNDKIFVY